MPEAEQKDFHFVTSGAPLGQAPVIVWAHGWGQSGAAFAAMSESFPNYTHLFLDFPGFGASPAPAQIWGTEDYADATQALLTRAVGARSVIWVGHSFGGRVGVQMAVRHGQRLRGLCLIAGAGLQRRRSLLEKLRIRLRVVLFKAVRALANRYAWAEKLKAQAGSADYRKASGVMRGIFVRVVNEDLTNEAAHVAVPTLLVYGEKDTETPPDFGQRYSALIKGAELHILTGQDHYSVLGQGRHIVIKRLKTFMDKL